MKNQIFQYGASALILLLVQTQPSMADPPVSPTSPATWEYLSAQSADGIKPARWRNLVQSCKAGGLTAETARQCLMIAEEACKNGLSPDPVLSRIEEGLAKNASPDTLLQAATKRVQAMKTVAPLVRAAGFDQTRPAHDSLVMASAMALESGVSPGGLQGVLTLSQGQQAERLRVIIEAGQTLRLGGLDDEAVGKMMNEYMERNMRCGEVMRATRTALQQHRGEMDDSRIQTTLRNRGAGDGRGDSQNRRANAPGMRGGTGVQPGAAAPGGGVLPIGGPENSGNDLHSKNGGK
jgi:hypothetical protein